MPDMVNTLRTKIRKMRNDLKLVTLKFLFSWVWTKK
jgi:hypothetical protein